MPLWARPVKTKRGTQYSHFYAGGLRRAVVNNGSLSILTHNEEMIHYLFPREIRRALAFPGER